MKCGIKLEGLSCLRRRCWINAVKALPAFKPKVGPHFYELQVGCFPATDAGRGEGCGAFDDKAEPLILTSGPKTAWVRMGYSYS